MSRFAQAIVDSLNEEGLVQRDALYQKLSLDKDDPVALVFDAASFTFENLERRLQALSHLELSLLEKANEFNQNVSEHIEALNEAHRRLEEAVDGFEAKFKLFNKWIPFGFSLIGCIVVSSAIFLIAWYKLSSDFKLKGQEYLQLIADQASVNANHLSYLADAGAKLDLVQKHDKTYIIVENVLDAGVDEWGRGVIEIKFKRH